MIIFPAIDIINGKCVRLSQGDYDQVTEYEIEPYLVAKSYEDKGGKFIHVVDLDGAKKGNQVNNNTIKKIVDNVNIPIEIGGGIRTFSDIENALSLGVYRVILGSVALNIDFVAEAVKRYGSEKIVVGIDAKDGYVAIKGWTEVTNKKATDLCLELKSVGIKTIIYTDIAKDGMMMGPNIEQTKQLVLLSGLDIVASGGVSTLDDVRKLKEINCCGAIVGKALFNGSMDLEDIIKEC